MSLVCASAVCTSFARRGSATVGKRFKTCRYVASGIPKTTNRNDDGMRFCNLFPIFIITMQKVSSKKCNLQDITQKVFSSRDKQRRPRTRRNLRRHRALRIALSYSIFLTKLGIFRNRRKTSRTRRDKFLISLQSKVLYHRIKSMSASCSQIQNYKFDTIYILHYASNEYPPNSQRFLSFFQ